MSVPCPTCHAPKNWPCIYVSVKVPSSYQYTEKTRARAALNGIPTKVPHNARRDRESERERRRQRAMARRARPLLVDPRAHERAQVRNALRQHDLIEYEQMRGWLQCHAGIFSS